MTSLRRMTLWWKALAARWQKIPAHEREFLPAELEILETPASPAGRTVALLIMVLFCVALVWSIVGRVDMNAVAQGKVVPLGGTQSIQPFEIGIVRKILVDDAQQVKKGDLLVVLDSAEEHVDLLQLERQLTTAQLDAGELQAFLATLEGQISPSAWEAQSSNTAQGERARSLLASRQAVYRAKVASVAAQRAEDDAMLAASASEIERLKVRRAVLASKEHALKTLLEHDGVARLKWLEAEQELAENDQTLNAERQRSRQHRATLSRLAEDLNQARAEFRREALTELTKANDQIREAQLSIDRYRQREQYRFLRAPVDGTVQQRAIHTVGGVVQPAQTLMIVVPHDVPMAVEVKVLNQDAGFVKPEQTVTLKIEAYSYTKYGTLTGTVESVSQDAVNDEKLGPVYLARIRLPRAPVSHSGHTLRIQTGMAVTAEIKTDERRVIDYLLSPIEEVTSESFRER
ncbi:Hemolysin secretion protein D, chromosomal [Pandoraea iniqua]|uniref:Membrane fusion protein (MFP) family protein n=1 Tax=Pandoraea iniqua TaxID=2508288 RepID=A0A5E4RRW0_9BURK|nr:HlyD family type I secretion periplasmic adaptor subunit [Pandoraea iniqua]VVD65775.1 Hemolysin secretion protein D, chromosomal [Pandoraea iniqua]